MDQQQEIANLEQCRDELSQELESATADVKLSLIGKEAKATDITVAAQTRQSALAQIIEGIDDDLRSKREDLDRKTREESRAKLIDKLAQTASDAHGAALLVEETHQGLDDILKKKCTYLYSHNLAIISARNDFMSIMSELVPSFRKWERLTRGEAAEVERATGRILQELANRGVDASVVRYDGWQPGASPADLHKYPLTALSSLCFGEAIKVANRIAARLQG
ncbi:MAG: hypothetical protein M3447_01680 [Acidobacteriota bacterium]|nr:hypothetical protein [Acidobacteriota bacterium]